MNVEDSYEGAVRRLRRLGQAGAELVPAQGLEDEPAAQSRMRDLEELATLACDDNERLERELAAAREQIGGLQRLVATLQETVANQQLGAIAAPSDTRIGRRFPYAFVMLLLAGAGGVALYTLRPWERRQYTPSLAVEAPTPSALPPVAAPPASVAKVEPPATAHVAAPQPAVVVPTVKVPPVKAQRLHIVAVKRHRGKHSRRGEAKHHAHQAASKADSTSSADPTDPLTGLNP